MLNAGNVLGLLVKSNIQIPEVMPKDTARAFFLRSRLGEAESETQLHNGRISITGEVLGSQ